MSEQSEWRESRLPLDLITRIDPAKIVLSMHVSGTPMPKKRPRVNTRTMTIYTPSESTRAERALRTVMLEARRGPLVRERVGVLLYFRIPSIRGKADSDNLAKLALDAANGAVWVDDSLVGELHVFLGRSVPNADAGTDMIVWVR